MVAWILVVHILGFTLWVGGLLATTIALSQHTLEITTEGREGMARVERIFLRGMADPGALLAVLAGITLIVHNPSYYLHARWLHIKLPIVVILIGLHVYIAVTTKSFTAGRTMVTPGQARLLLAAVIVLFLLILISTLPGEVFLT